MSKAFAHHYSGELVRLKAMSAPEVCLTPNHEVFAVHCGGPDEIVKVPAGELTKDHYLVVPKRATGTLSRLDVARTLAD